MSIVDAGHTGECHFEPEISTLNKENVLLICTSTHGAGDLPDNIVPYAKGLQNENLQGIKAMIVGLGDSSYDTYCGAAMKMETLLLDRGVTLLTEPLHIDVLHHPIPEDVAVEWFVAQLDKVSGHYTSL